MLEEQKNIDIGKGRIAVLEKPKTMPGQPKDLKPVTLLTVILKVLYKD